MIRVVTLPPDGDALAFALRARRSGADLLEVRDDLRDEPLDALAKEMPLLLAHRGGRGFKTAAQWVDAPLGSGLDATIWSHHAEQTLTPEAAEALWAKVPAGVHIKHVEPAGPHLLETQRRLIARHGRRVTVLGVGPLALPWRAVLAEHNALDYLALENATAAAAGQRLLRDAVRGGTGARLALIGHRIEHARSPWAHPPPFDRWDLPPDAPVGALVDALKPHYRGFAVTAPFKQALAAHVGAKQRAINTLVRRPDGWLGANTDVDGARAVLERHGVTAFTLLGDGGAAWALRAAAKTLPTVVKWAAARHVRGDSVWTWPAQLDAPEGLKLDGARVLIIAYGAGGHRIAEHVRRLGGTPVRAGARWFAAQARAQRRLWMEAS
jgi:hypothetical protein